ncbi:MAG TPA: exo-alpha-sialidase [Clostridiaceae bacterium]|nr:exo-alpha-sialidase [Clostridiaceae bacterium]
MERYIAIDNVCAWPNLTLLKDGSIAALCFNRPSHGRFEGEVQCWVSTDGGYLWEKRGVPVPHESGTNRMNVAAGLTKDGALIAICSGWGPVPPFGYEQPHEFNRKVLDSVISCSFDGGKTWIQGGSIDKPEGVMGFMPYGDIVQISEGVLGVCFHTWGDWTDKGVKGFPNFTSYFVKSYDDGKTWVDPVVIGRDDRGMAINNNETAVICLDKNHLLAAARTLDDQHLELYESKDSGMSWIRKGPVTLPFQHPGHFLKLKDGSILLTYGIRNKGFYGIGGRISRDNGENWSEPIFLLNFEIATDGGYPSSVQLDDGTIVTAYYSNKVPYHNRYHMGVIHWKLDEFGEIRYKQP